MKLAVIGAGAMGGSLAGHAARAGHDVTVVDVSSTVIEQVSKHGLRVCTPEGTFTAAVSVTDDPSTAGPVDLVVLFVKAQHTEAASQSLQPLVGPATAVVTLQNGWGNADRIAKFVPEEQLVVGVTYNSCTASGTGQVVHSGRGRTVMGPFRGTGTQYAHRAADLLNDSGWEAEVSTAVLTEIWKKLVLNTATLPTAALTRLNAGAVGEPGELLDLVDGLAAETVAVAVAQGLDIDLGERVSAIHGVLERAGAGRASMLQDVLAGRKTEVETVNGAVVAAGVTYGVQVPLNKAMVALVHSLERSYLS
ncbi:MAG: ketopantoate reductase family protein [Streptosporangiaceae bacterium]